MAVHEISGGKPSRKTAHLRSIPSAVSTETVECLERLLHEARSGRLIGIAFAGIMRHQRYVHHACGEVLRQRVLTRGVLLELDDLLRDR